VQKYFHTFAAMKKEMENFELIFKEAMLSEVVPMDEIMAYVASAKGKRLRPTLVFLSAKLFGEINETTRRTALFAEMLHTATLIHDDVVDGSNVRRGQDSVNAHWDNKTAVLAGDYLLAKAMKLLSDPADHLILKEMLGAVLAMSEGEMLQNSEYGMNSELYLNVIERKTARLIRACCVGGMLSVIENNSSFLIPHSSLNFGLSLGMVFQMRDDILDADNPEITALAEQLLPEYLDKTLKALDALEPYIINLEALASLRELTMFCATRNM
jgi:octaprenyl-diphosphate synthase